MTFPLYTQAALKVDLPERDLREGQVGYIVEHYPMGEGHEDGYTLEIEGNTVEVDESQLETVSVIKIDPYILEQLQNVRFPFADIKELTKDDDHTIVVFADIGPDNARYETFGYYLTSLKVAKELSRSLKEVRSRYGLHESYIHYKKRKHDKRKSAFSEWINTVAHHPGLIYVLAFDKTSPRNQALSIETKKEYKQELASFGLRDKIEIYERMIRSLCFLPVLRPYLDENYKLLWIMDNDAIFDTSERIRILMDSVRSLMSDSSLKLASPISFATPFADTSQGEYPNDLMEELLSIADVAAGSYGSALQIDRSEHPFESPDEETTEMIESLAKMPPVADFRKLANQKPCVFGFNAFDFHESFEDGSRVGGFRLKDLEFRYRQPGSEEAQEKSKDRSDI